MQIKKIKIEAFADVESFAQINFNSSLETHLTKPHLLFEEGSNLTTKVLKTFKEMPLLSAIFSFLSLYI